MLITIAQLLLSLSILVVLHELGHFIPAKIFKTRVEKFYLFFNPYFSLFKKKIGETTYGIGWLPLGGYVKISGMVDESMDKEQMKKPPEPWEFRAKPVWQRLIVMVGGVTVNLLLGFAIYAMVLFVWGREYLPVHNLTYGVAPSELMKSEGFQDGDKIVDVEGRDPKTMGDVSLAILIDGARHVTVERLDPAGQPVKQRIELSANIQEQILERNDKSLFSPRFPFVVDSVLANNNAAKTGGFRKGDRIVAVNGEPARYFHDFVEAVKDKK